MQVREEFLHRINTYKNIEAKQKKLFDTISTTRLLVFLAGTALTITCFVKKQPAYGFVTLAVFLTAFIFLVYKHHQVENTLKKATNKIKINQSYIDRMDGNWINFSDSGQKYVDVSHQYTNDLDIFGAKSLYQWISTANTFHGKETLKNFLENPQEDINVIKKRQNAVKELAEKLDFCQELQCESMNVPDIQNYPHSLMSYVQNTSKLFSKKWIVNVFYTLPIITITTLVLFFLNAITYYIPFTLIAIHGLILLIGYPKVKPILNSVYGFRLNIEAYRSLIKLIENESFNDSYLTELKSNLSSQNKSASTEIKGLEKIVDAINFQYNPYLYFFLDVFLLFDYHLLFALEEWKDKNGKYIEKWLQTIGHFEAISSISVILHVNSQSTFPEFTEKELRFSAVEMGHPLIVQNKRVCNNINIKNTICVITGSNMSGKTTLLRTVGINLVLAYAGAPVCAKRLECSIMSIFTSMRITDDLNGGISTFYAELLRIKMIIDYSHSKHSMIFLIDEIFRGTNSNDRTIGARNVLKNLSKKWVIGLISTHDFELCDLEGESNIQNCHFTETYLREEIKFDYKLHLGRCNTTNARYLMKMVGIELLE